MSAERTAHSRVEQRVVATAVSKAALTAALRVDRLDLPWVVPMVFQSAATKVDSKAGATVVLMAAMTALSTAVVWAGCWELPRAFLTAVKRDDWKVALWAAQWVDLTEDYWVVQTVSPRVLHWAACLECLMVDQRGTRKAADWAGWKELLMAAELVQLMAAKTVFHWAEWMAARWAVRTVFHSVARKECSWGNHWAVVRGDCSAAMSEHC